MLGIPGLVSAEHKETAKNTCTSSNNMPITGPASLPQFAFCLVLFMSPVCLILTGQRHLITTVQILKSPWNRTTSEEVPASPACAELPRSLLVPLLACPA